MCLIFKFGDLFRAERQLYSPKTRMNYITLVSQSVAVDTAAWREEPAFQNKITELLDENFL